MKVIGDQLADPFGNERGAAEIISNIMQPRA